MSEPIQLDLSLNNLVRKSESKDLPSKAIFFLHGFGSNMQDLLVFLRFLIKIGPALVYRHLYLYNIMDGHGQN